VQAVSNISLPGLQLQNNLRAGQNTTPSPPQANTSLLLQQSNLFGNPIGVNIVQLAAAANSVMASTINYPNMNPQALSGNPMEPGLDDDEAESRSPSDNAGVQLIQEVLREMKQNHTISQTRLDAMEFTSHARFDLLKQQGTRVANQVVKITKNVENLIKASTQLQESHLEIMKRLQQLEGTAPSSSGSPVRKKRTDDEYLSEDEARSESSTSQDRRVSTVQYLL
jgi:hypothetical protein